MPDVRETYGTAVGAPVSPLTTLIVMLNMACSRPVRSAAIECEAHTNPNAAMSILLGFIPKSPTTYEVSSDLPRLNVKQPP